jgi:hypothetical protein
MVTWQEILGKYKESEIPAEHLVNMKELLVRINKLRKAYGKVMSPTNCYRSMAHHLRIYKDKGITDKAKIPMASKHLFGQAIDIADPNGELHDWCKKNEKLLEEIGIWLENRQGSWQHFQIVPFRSYKKGGTIWFNP